MPDRAGEFRAGADCLILRRPDGKHVIYAWEDEELSRSEGSVAGDATRAVEGRWHNVTFARGGPGGRLIILRFRHAKGTGPLFQPKEIVAALGGDLQ